MKRNRTSKARREDRGHLLQLGTSEHYEDAELYDFEYAEQSVDIDWYIELAQKIRPQDPILELGGGSGRISIPLAQQGHQIIALDRMQSMLDRLQSKLRKHHSLAGSVKSLCADMREIPLEKSSVGLVLAPFNALMHLYTWEDLLQCFEEVYRVLKPGGSFALDVLLPDLDWLKWDPHERHGVTPFTHPKSGEKMIYSTNHSYDPETQVCHIRIYYDKAVRGRHLPRHPKNSEVVHLAHRQIFPQELRALISLAGFEIKSHGGDFMGISLQDSVESQVLLAVKT